jgi:hypothetical protein
MIITLQKLKKGRLLDMKDMGIVYGSASQAVPLIIGKDTVYEHTDIEQVFEDQEGNPVDNLYRFHEIQYDKDEYIKIITERSKTTEMTLDTLLTEILPNLML